MKKIDLEYLKNNTSTGDDFNKQLIAVQVETVYSLDKLIRQLKKLNLSIEESNKKSESLEKSNYRLQFIMFLLALFSSTITVFPIIKTIVEELGIYGFNQIAYSVAGTSIIIILLSLLIQNQIKKIEISFNN